MSSLVRDVFRLGFEISPVILTGGIAAQIPGGMLPIVLLTEASSFVTGLLGGSIITNLDQYFAHWKPLPGSTLIENTIGAYPFGNQATAANALIAQPLVLSMLMICPVQSAGGYLSKLSTMTVLQQTLQTHNTSGGTYTVATPSQIYTNLILSRVTDVSTAESKQAQNQYKFDFLQPLITINQAQQVYNSLMNKIAGGLPVAGQPAWSGAASTVGSNLAGASGASIPSLTNLSGSVAASPAFGALGSGFSSI